MRKYSNTRTDFLVMAAAYIDEHAIALGRCGPARERGMRGDAAIMGDWLADRGYAMEDLTRPVVLEMLMFLAGRAPVDDTIAGGARSTAARVPDELDPDGLVTFSQALTLPGLHGKRSTFKRAKADGTLAHRGNDAGIQVFRIADLYAVAGRKNAAAGDGGPRRGRGRSTDGYSQTGLENKYHLFREICDYAVSAHHITVPDTWRSLRTPKSVKVPAGPDQQRPVASLANVATIATGLHAVHQVVLWILAILGPRISEVYGIRVGDVFDSGPAQPGLLWIHRQGGRKHGVRDPKTGNLSNVDTVDRVKTGPSDRVLVIPPILMTLIRHVIAIFHTSPHGIVRPDARLIPGLRTQDVGGIGGFTTALRKLPVRITLVTSPFETDDQAEDYLRPHDLRRRTITILEGADLNEAAVRRFAGHLIGNDVHSGYILDDPRFTRMHEIAEFLETELRAEVGESLLIPTTVSCTTPQQGALHARRNEIEPALIALGWYVPQAADNGEELLGSRQVAEILDVAPTTARRWMRDGAIEAWQVQRDGKSEWVTTAAIARSSRGLVA